MADNVAVQGIEFEIRGSAEQASKSLQSFADSLKKANTNANGKGLQNLAANLKDVADSLGKLDANGITALANALESTKGKSTSLKKIAEYLTQISQIKFDNLTGFTNAMASIPANLPKTGERAQSSGTTEPSHRWADFYEKAKELPSLWKSIAAAEKAATEGITTDSLQHWLETVDPLKSIAGTVFQPLGASLAWVEDQFNRSGVTIGDFFRGFTRSGAMAEEGATGFVKVLDFMRGTISTALNGAMSLVNGFGSAVSRGFQKAASGALSAVKAFGKFALALPTTKVLGSSIKGISNFIGKLGQLGSAFKRILMYRLIRTAIKEIGEAFTEGEKHAYGFSKQFGETTKYISEAYDRLSSASFKMGNQMGAAWATLYAQIAPIIESIIALITRAMQVISQFFAALGGRGTYMKAIDYSKEWADETKKGAGAAKEWKNQLMSFDEINKLNEPSKGGGGGGGLDDDYGSMFREADIEDDIASFVSQLKKGISQGDWSGVGQLLAKKINSIFPSAEKWSEWGTKLGKYTKGIINTAYYALADMDFSMYGERIAGGLNSALEASLGDEGGGSMAYNFGRLCVRGVTAGWDFLISFVMNLDWGLIGKALGDGFRGSFDEMTKFLQRYDWSNIGETLWRKFKELIAGIDFASLAKSFFTYLGSAFRATIGFIGGFIGGIGQDIADWWAKDIRGTSFKETMSNLWEAVKTGLGNVWEFVRDNIIDPFMSALLGTDNWPGIEQVGKDIWDGFTNGLTEFFSAPLEWIRTHITEPFINAWNDLFGIASPSTVFEEIGGFIVEGFKNGISEPFARISSWVDTNIVQPFVSAVSGLFDIDWSGVFSGLITWANTACNWIMSVLQGIGLLNSASGGSAWQSGGGFSGRGGKFAEGGYPESGQLFIARENGPELVGQIGNRTAVANNDQITTAIADAVYGAIVSAMPQGGSNTPVIIYMDGKEIARSTTKYQTQFARANG